MRWEDERYVRFYTRDTPEFLALSWAARGLFGLVLRKLDRAGILKVGKLGLRGVAVAVGGPWSEVEGPLRELLADGCLVFDEEKASIMAPNYMPAQDAPQSDAARKRASREKARADFGGSSDAAEKARLVTNRDGNGSHNVTKCHEESRSVTFGHVESLLPVPSRAEPSQADPDTHDRAREDVPGEGDNRPLAALWPDEDAPDLRALAEELAGEEGAAGGLGTSVLERLTRGRNPTQAQREALRRIAAERRQRAQRLRGTPAPTDEERAVVAVYLDAQKRIRREKLPELDLHFTAARRLLPDLRRLAAGLARDDWAPTAADVTKHKLETFLRLNDPRLAEQGYPLALLLARTDATDLPKPPRKTRTTTVMASAPPEQPRVQRPPEELFTAIGAGEISAPRPRSPPEGAAREEILAKGGEDGQRRNA